MLLVGLAGGYVIYRNALREANAFFDYHLRETALLLRDQAYGFPASPGLPEESRSTISSCRSGRSTACAFTCRAGGATARTQLGLSTVETPQGRWRAFSVLARGT